MPMRFNSDLITADKPEDGLEKIRRSGWEIYQAVEDNLERGVQAYPFKKRLPENDISFKEKWKFIRPYR
jgi:hypothetical protein